MLASDNGHSDVAKLLLDNGAQVNLTDIDGFSALDLAYKPEMIDLLVGRGEGVKIGQCGVEVFIIDMVPNRAWVTP